ncbi:MAG: ZIP family metal transporter [Spirochaetales bacterium]|nr:ZIP family metal transporter [Spirochaetales bacterium]
MDPLLLGISGSLLAGLATGIGAAGVFLIRRLSLHLETILLSGAAGIMLAATFFSLIDPALELSAARMPGVAGVLIVTGGIGLGAFFLAGAHALLPHEHFISGTEGPPARVARIWLFIVAIALHNFPEGMAVGAGFGAGGLSGGLSLATGIGLQNMPEGLAVAAGLLALQYSRWQAFSIAFLTGLIEPFGGLIGSLALWLAEPLVPGMLGFAAGAMLYVISNEIIPETHGGNYKSSATFSFLSGFVLMILLDHSFA